jgi:hypothetical protein
MPIAMPYCSGDWVFGKSEIVKVIWQLPSFSGGERHLNCSSMQYLTPVYIIIVPITFQGQSVQLPLMKESEDQR